jgi:hypothetical protein
MYKLIIKSGNVSKEYHVQTFEELKEIEKDGKCDNADNSDSLSDAIKKKYGIAAQHCFTDVMLSSSPLVIDRDRLNEELLVKLDNIVSEINDFLAGR